MMQPLDAGCALDTRRDSSLVLITKCIYYNRRCCGARISYIHISSSQTRYVCISVDLVHDLHASGGWYVHRCMDGMTSIHLEVPRQRASEKRRVDAVSNIWYRDNRGQPLARSRSE
jgi:hypothetical protein